MILKDKLMKNEYMSYENYEEDLQIFLNFCFDNLIDKTSDEYMDIKELIRMKMIY